MRFMNGGQDSAKVSRPRRTGFELPAIGQKRFGHFFTIGGVS
jgi:hypothetical protein